MQRYHVDSSRTVRVHIVAHNVSIGRSGFCAPCKRTQSKFSTVIAGKGFLSSARLPFEYALKQYLRIVAGSDSGVTRTESCFYCLPFTAFQ